MRRTLVILAFFVLFLLFLPKKKDELGIAPNTHHQYGALSNAQWAIMNPILSERGPTIVAFTAKWCYACQVLEEDLKHELVRYPQISFRPIDVDQEDESVAATFNVQSLPDVYLFDKDKNYLGEVLGADTVGIFRLLDTRPISESL